MNIKKVWGTVPTKQTNAKIHNNDAPNRPSRGTDDSELHKNVKTHLCSSPVQKVAAETF